MPRALRRFTKPRYLITLLAFVAAVALFAQLRERASWRPRVYALQSPPSRERERRASVRTGLRFFRTATDSNIAFAADGHTVAAIPESEGALQLWQLPGCTLSGRASLPTALKQTLRMAFSPSGAWLAATNGRDVLLWRVREGQPEQVAHHIVPGAAAQYPAPRYLDTGTALCFSPDGNFLAVTNRGRELEIPYDHFEFYRAVPTEAPPSLTVWHTGTHRRVWSETRFSAHCIAFAPDGRTLAVGTPRQLMSLDATTGAVRRKLDCNYRIDHLAFAPDGHTLVTLMNLGTSSSYARNNDAAVLQRRDAATLELLPDPTMLPHSYYETLALSPHGKRILVTRDGNAELYSYPDLKPISVRPELLKLPANGNSGWLAFFPDDRHLAAVQPSYDRPAIRLQRIE